MSERPQVENPEKRMHEIILKIRKEPGIDILAFEEVFQLALILHKDHKRKNGEPYITHLLAACEILIFNFKINNIVMIQAILLHDSVED
jgi:(p)ppGpp synthase/HD superfamily hydrolase